MSSTSGRLAGKVAIITGGANGIGRASVHRFIAEGATVVAADLNVAAGRDLEAECTEAGYASSAFRFLPCDVSDEGAVEGLIASTVQAYGRLDCLFNNAGTSGKQPSVIDLETDDWHRMLRNNLDSVFFGIKHGARAMKGNADGGSIINTSSLAALSGGAGPTSYASSKAGVISLTQSSAVQLAAMRIRVNAISPGSILTDLVIRLRGAAEKLIPVMERTQPWPEHGTAEHVAGAALFLASEDARFVTGHNLVVDGGLTAAGPRFFDRIREIEEGLERERAAAGSGVDDAR